MSHVSSSAVIIKDIAALREAVKQFPELTFVEGQKTYEWYGHWANDFGRDDAAYKRHGIDPKDYGKCSHAIKVAGTTWEIGVVERKQGGYALVWDFYGSQGRPINAVVGEQGTKLATQYSRFATINSAKRNGFWVQQKKLPNGEYDLILSKV